MTGMEEYIANVKQRASFYSEGKHSLSRPAILHCLRSKRENGHRHWLHQTQTHQFAIYRPSLDSEGYGPMSIDEQAYYCNKTAPFYVLPMKKGNYASILPLFLVVIHNWLYKKWFRPYRSEIEFGQFISGVVYPKDVPDQIGLVSLFTHIVGISEYVREQVNELYQFLAPPGGVPVERQGGWMSLFEPDDVDFYHLKPLFRAVAIVLDPNIYDDETHAADVGQLPVFIIRTGVETGLSAPITFDSIPDSAIMEFITQPDGEPWSAVRTRLVTAFDFLQAMDEREIAAFGPRPDPKRVPKGPFQGLAGFCDGDDLREFEEDARRLGWEGDLTLNMSSATWVDTGLFTEWFGCGQDADQRILRNFYEEFYRRQFKRIKQEVEGSGEVLWQTLARGGSYF